MRDRMRLGAFRSNTISLALGRPMRYSLESRGPDRVARPPLTHGIGVRNPGVAVVSSSDHTGLDGSTRSRAGLDERSWRASWPGFLALAVALAPCLSAIWVLPWFVTQDGPAHVYNAQILADSFDPRSPSHAVYTISWKPIPNWMGHIVLAGLVSWLPAWVADRIMTSATLVGLAAATLWLRWRVAGGKGLVSAALLSALLAMNFTWLTGLHELPARELLVSDHARHLVGRTVPAVEVAHREFSRFLLCLGYFCHLVSLGLTVVGLAVLSVAGPVPSGAADGRGSSAYRGWPARR